MRVEAIMSPVETEPDGRFKTWEPGPIEYRLSVRIPRWMFRAVRRSYIWRNR